MAEEFKVITTGREFDSHSAEFATHIRTHYSSAVKTAAYVAKPACAG
jgi:hypothetical protein